MSLRKQVCDGSGNYTGTLLGLVLCAVRFAGRRDAPACHTNSRSCKKARKVAVLNASQGRAGYTAYTGWPARSW